MEPKFKAGDEIYFFDINDGIFYRGRTGVGRSYDIYGEFVYTIYLIDKAKTYVAFESELIKREYICPWER